ARYTSRMRRAPSELMNPPAERGGGVTPEGESPAARSTRPSHDPKRVKIPMCPWHREGYTFQARPRRVGVSSVRTTSGHVEGVAGLLLAGVAAGLVARADAAGGEAVVLGQAAPPALADRHEGSSAGVDPDSGHG